MKFIIVVLLTFFIVPSASAKLHLEVQEDVTVYSRPDIESKVVAQLHYGDMVRIFTKDLKGFRKVVLVVDGRRRVGFVRRIDLKHSRVRTKFPLVTRYTLGVGLVGSYLRQGDREIETGGGTYKASVFDGFQQYFEVYYEWPLKTNWQGRLFFNYRRASLEGDAELSGGSTSTEFEFQEEFFGVGLLAKKYFESRKQVWAGASIEYAKGSEVTVTVLNGTPLNDDEAEPPIFLIFSGHIGYDWPLTDHFYFVTEARVGSVVTTDPFTLMTELHLSGVYAF